MEQRRTSPDDRDQYVSRERDSGLCLPDTLSSAEEGLDAQMPFDPPERKFDLPTALRAFGEYCEPESGVVGQKRLSLDRLAPSYQPPVLRCHIHFDLAERVAQGQLREGHRVELVGARERLDFMLGAVERDAATRDRKRLICPCIRKHELTVTHYSFLWNDSWTCAKCMPRSLDREQT